MILVTGATGTIGGPLVRILAEAGAPFRALVRDEAKGRALGCPFFSSAIWTIPRRCRPPSRAWTGCC